eukprot:CAMPEP_0184985614 /NCGR_PEP_ID=MMETSP1098-20130426/14206_1 /TAXON_ID=89044 /ORGANISM="Spumella elongata, Strain CCAP 955/1" /LENGTH=500 /DNA_ID=CAMNT_0027509707 /DNA_START=33 /DNA_END=1532 /DNA_ORIENTATION=-
MSKIAKEAKVIADSWSNLNAAFASGKTKSYAWRYAQLGALKVFLKDHENSLKEALNADLGRHPFEAIGLDLLGCMVELDYIMKNLKTWMKPTYTEVPLWMTPASSEIVYEPFGTVLVLGPFNYPVSLTLSPLMGAIAAGNCVLIKPSEMTSAVEKVLYDELPRYIDNDCIKVVTGGVSVTTDLLKLRWDKIFFTGSPRVGKIVMKAASEFLTPVSLELGGKSPTIIDESVGDLDLAAQRVMWGKCANAGQTCIAPDYVFCHEKHYDAFLELCKQKLKQFYGADPQRAVDFGRIVSTMHCQRLKGMIDEVGPKSIVVGGKVDENEKYVEPTVLKDVSMNSKVMTEEIFGPLLPVLKYKDINAVIKHIKENEKPLTLYIFARNRRLIDRLTNEISSGSAVVNDCLYQFANLYAPFGGVGESGMGGYHGHFSFTCFSHRRPILRRDDHAILDVPFRYPPYSDFALSIFRFAMSLPINQPRITYCGLFKAALWAASVVAVSAVW